MADSNRANGTIVTLDRDNFNETVLRQDDRPVLVDYWAPWCGPCRAMEPLLHELATELGERVVVAKVNVDEQPELAGAAHVRAIPTMHLVHRGEVVDVMIGAQPLPALRAKLDKIATSQPG